MKQVLRTPQGDVPIRTTTELATGNPNLARMVKQSGGATLVDSHTKNGNAVVAETPAQSHEIPFSEKNPEYYDVSADLPSKFMFYPFESLSVRPLTVQEAKKIFQAQTLKSMRMMVEAVSSCLQPGLSAFDLTRGDFYYLLYWLRIQSFKKSPYVLNFTCTNVEHIEKVVNDELPKESLFNEQLVHKVGELDIQSPVFADVQAQIDVIQKEYGLHPYPTTMRDVVDTDELDQKDENGKTLVDENGEPLPPSQDVLWTAKYASVLSPYEYGRTLQERMAYFDTLTTGPDLLGDLDLLISLFKHGVQESTIVSCKECGAKMETKVSINALTFFPAVHRA